MTDRYEVIVCGGGMVGAATACALAQGGVKVALLKDLILPDNGRRNRLIIECLL